MAKASKSMSVKQRAPAFADHTVGAVFDSYPKPLRTKLLALRRLILETAATTKGVGKVEETLKWGQPSYLTSETKSGSTIRIGEIKADAGQYALFVHCQTNLVSTFQELYPKQFSYGGNRSVIFDIDDELPEPELRHCIGLALTYHRNKRKSPR
jgi:hypothetical protein